MAESRAKVFECDGCHKTQNAETTYRRKAPPGWLFRETTNGRVVSCSSDCTVKIDDQHRPAWDRVAASEAT